ncbi:6-carboxytetrahydropterin synthase [Halodesulfovibrio sp.]|jgi:6-pyruvoyltetrahydropterin/6-carboxytetrahydropterin synthase|uniref:6-pyruvoyl trahydropterin synthase family protein n=1 Tax=Halodesulfovibrio sp. TaxID=1912772 RepID=UPI0025CF1343|nr:6-carboxytetrahydropterin synthase [Halodesulfovibrio sp.]MCT4533992.1 6-carboxytetrahydropterin synthase [Halodesulfovibrio sp.]MCT4627183.1 6-carboxytetrahydropterin synthase [Halodesulfovibrio sp.]
MANGIWRLTVRSDFAAAHALRNYDGKCENIHGHNFAVEAVVEGDKLSEDVEILLDFKVMKNKLKEVTELIDHKDLNCTPPFDAMNPSSENLARFIYQELGKRIESYGVRVHSVTVSEKAAQSATYLEL